MEGAPSGGSVQLSRGPGGGLWKNVKIASLLVQTYQSSREICWFVQGNVERRWDCEMQVVYNQGQDLLIALPTQLICF